MTNITPVDSEQTALNQWHRDKGAKMVDFAGFDMPVSYPLGVMKEHLFTRSDSGLFDVSHMGQFLVCLNDQAKQQLNSAEILERIAISLEAIFPADLLALPMNHQVYSLLLNDKAGVVDDLMICKREFDFILVVNAGCKQKDYEYLRSLLPDEIDLRALNDQSLLALQGPKAEAALSSLRPKGENDADFDFSTFTFMQASKMTIQGIECFVTRSGYTGEDGFEISLTNQDAETLANLLCSQDIVEPIGLGARDSLRLEAGLCLYGHELNEEINPVSAKLKWAIAKSRRPDGIRPGGFIASDDLFSIWDGSDEKSIERVALLGSKKTPVRDGVEIVLLSDDDSEVSDANAYINEGSSIGSVVSGGVGPSLVKPIAMAYVTTGSVALGDTVYGKVRKKLIPMTVVKTPFVANRYKR